MSFMVNWAKPLAQAQGWLAGHFEGQTLSSLTIIDLLILYFSFSWSEGFILKCSFFQCLVTFDGQTLKLVLKTEGMTSISDFKFTDNFVIQVNIFKDKFRTLRTEAKPFGWKCPNIYRECTKMFPTSLYLHYVFFRLPPWATAKSPTRQCLRGWPKRIQLRGTESHLRNTVHRKITAIFTKWETDAVFGNLTVLIHTNRISCLATGDNSTHKTVTWLRYFNLWY